MDVGGIKDFSSRGPWFSVLFTEYNDTLFPINDMETFTNGAGSYDYSHAIRVVCVGYLKLHDGARRAVQCRGEG